jgi:hypothetical protein
LDGILAKSSGTAVTAVTGVMLIRAMDPGSGDVREKEAFRQKKRGRAWEGLWVRGLLV